VKVLVAAVYGETITCQLQSDDQPECGKSYYLEDATDGTSAQNRFFHLLVHLYFDSRCFSDDAHEFYELRQHILRRLGRGFEKYIYVDYEWNLQVVNKRSEIPDGIVQNKDRVRAQLWGWTGYSLPARRQTIKRLIAEMMEAGVTGKEFESILKEYHDG